VSRSAPQLVRLATITLALGLLPLSVDNVAQAIAAPSLADAHLGVPLSAPGAPPVTGLPATSVTYVWQRCLYYSTLVTVDGATHLWHLDDADSSKAAVDTLSTTTGVYSGARASVSDGSLHGQSDPAATFDGATSALAVPAAPDYQGTQAYSVELWVRPHTIDHTYRFLFSRESSTSAGRQGTGIWLSSTGLGFERWRDGVSTSVDYALGLPKNAWSQVVATYDGATMRLYVNGSLVGSRAATTSLLSQATSSEIGVGSGGHSGFFAGDIDEVSLYSHALARAHVAAHAAAATAAPCTTIPGATSSTYTPVVADLGRTLSTTVTSTNTHGNATITGQSPAPTDDGHGQLVAATIGGLVANTTVAGTVQVTATVAGLPADRIEWDLDGQYRYAKEAEAPYQYTWYTNGEANGPHTVTVRLWGPGASTPVSTQVTVNVSNAALHPTPLAFGKESMYALFNEGDLASAQNLLANVWPARGYALPYLGWPLTWTEDPYHDAYWEFYFYGMQPLPALLYEWENTGQAPYLEKLIAILRSYVAYDRTRPVDRTTFDNDHASAYRTMALVQFYVKLKRAGVLPADLEAGLLVSLRKLGGFLAEPSHFEADYNHGFNEGAALLLLADNFPSMPEAAAWRQIAIARLQQMLTNTIDADGVEVENSPFYHVYVLGLIYQIAQWAERYEPTLASAYTAAAQKMLAYAADITQPNGYLPMLGATATTYMPSQDPVVYGPMAAANPAFDFAFTRGAKGTPPPDGTVLFPVSGLFIMRSPLGATSNLPNQTYVTFNAGTYRTSHSDLDALGMTMYTNGATLLPTSGLFTYTQEPDLEYFHGTRSHNTVTVDGQDQAPGSAQAGSHGSSEDATWASGVSGLYAGVSHHRTIVILRQGLVLVTDDLSSSTSHDYAQTWHMAPGSSVEGLGAEVNVRNASGLPTLTIHQADSTGVNLKSFEGATEPMQGWYSNGYGFKQPDRAIEYHRMGAAALFTTLLAAGPYATQKGSVSETSVAGEHQVSICMSAGLGYTVIVPTANVTAPTITATGCGVSQ
jgi:hypothetical protein